MLTAACSPNGTVIACGGQAAITRGENRMELPFGKFVRQRRIYLGFRTQADLAEALGITPDYVSWIERGKASPARLEGKTLRSLSVTLQIDEGFMRRWTYEGSVPADAWKKGNLFTGTKRSIGLCQILLIALEHRSVLEELLKRDTISEAQVHELLVQKTGADIRRLETT